MDETFKIIIGASTRLANKRFDPFSCPVVIQFETLIHKKWYPVVRYDIVHGYAHKDVLDRRGRVIEKVEMANMDYNKALQMANLDIDSNWGIYKQRLSKGR